MGLKTKQVILTKLFDTGGSNSHLMSLLRYWGPGHVLLALEEAGQKKVAEQLALSAPKIKIVAGLYPYAHLRYQLTTTLKELFKMLVSAVRMALLCTRYGVSGLTISSVEPEKFLYLFWLPFLRITYILHTVPDGMHTSFTRFTCNKRLGKRKKIVVVSEFMKQTLEQHWQIQPGKRPFVFTVHNTVNESISKDAGSVREPRKIKTVLTLGRTDNNKNPAVWLKVAQQVTSKLPDVNFHWIGGGAELSTLQKLYAGSSRILMEGPVSEPSCHFRKAYIYFQPSLTESHGIAVVEAMCYGLPCVVSAAGGLTESVLDDYNGVLIDPEQTENCAEAIQRLLTDAQLAARFGRNGRERYEQLFSYNKFQQQMDKVYNRKTNGAVA